MRTSNSARSTERNASFDPAFLLVVPVAQITALGRQFAISGKNSSSFGATGFISRSCAMILSSQVMGYPAVVDQTANIPDAAKKIVCGAMASAAARAPIFPTKVLPVKKMKSSGSLRSSVFCSLPPATKVTAPGS
jgi:hypothetical protein